MSDLEQKIRALLDEENRKFDSHGDGEITATNWSMRTVWRYTYWWHVVSTVLLLGCMFAMPGTGAPAYFVFGIVAIMITIGLCVVKLWYWICFTRFSTHKEIKRLELQIADLVKQLETSKEIKPSVEK